MSQTEDWVEQAAAMRRFLAPVESASEYNGVALNEGADTRIIDGPALELIPPGRGRSTTRGMRP